MATVFRIPPSGSTNRPKGGSGHHPIAEDSFGLLRMAALVPDHVFQLHGESLVAEGLGVLSPLNVVPYSATAPRPLDHLPRSG